MQELVNSTIHPNDEMMAVMKKNGMGLAHYLESGKKNTEVFYEIVRRHKPNLLTGRVLDYGCGYGRMTRHFKNYFSPAIMVSADVTADMVNFCANEFGSIPFLISDDNPISNFKSKFDVIIAVSVFSHLPPKNFENNMIALSHSLDDNGLLMFTTAGEQVAKTHKVTLENGFSFGQGTQNTNETNGRLPVETYASMCVTPFYVKNILNLADLNLLEFIPNGHVGKQDLFVVTHR